MEKKNSVKFFYNGIKVNGGKLRKCYFNLHDDGSVTVYADDYGTALPRDLFPVKNDTDIYTDYFDKDSACLEPDHPLYKYAHAAAVKAAIKSKERHIKSLERYIEKHPRYADHYRKEIAEAQERISSLSTVQIEKGQPTDADLAKIEQQRQEAENARREREHEEELKRREEMLRKRNEGRRFIEQTMNEYPVKGERDPVVRICWSEHPAFYSWEDDALVMSVAAAEIVLKKFDDEEHAKNEGYDKTKFRVEYFADDADDERSTYEGRYDLGDGDGGLIEHIRSFGEWNRTHNAFGHEITTDEQREQNAEHIAEAEQIVALADMLNRYTANGNIVEVKAAAWLEMLARKKQEQQNAEIREMKEKVEMMTDDQLAAAVEYAMTAFNSKTAARVFLQELAERDHDRAYSLFQKWIKEA